MGIKNNKGYINLLSDKKSISIGGGDLEVYVTDDNMIAVKIPNAVDGTVIGYDLAFTLDEIEALHTFAKLVKQNIYSEKE